MGAGLPLNELEVLGLVIILGEHDVWISEPKLERPEGKNEPNRGFRFQYSSICKDMFR